MNRAFMRGAMLVTGVVTMAAGCQSSPLCTHCPDLSGAWNITFANDTSTGDCASFGVGDTASQVLNVTQNGSTVNAELYGFALTGPLLQSGLMSLTGSNPLGDGGANDFASLDLEATVGAPAEGSTQSAMTGTVTGDFQEASGGASGGTSETTTCTLDRDFSALQ